MLQQRSDMVQDVEAVAPAYELDDLDDEWKELLSELDARLLTVSPLTGHG